MKLLYTYFNNNIYFIIMVRAWFYIRWLLNSRCAQIIKTRSFSEKKIGYDDSFDVTKCLQQIEMPDSLHVCA